MISMQAIFILSLAALIPPLALLYYVNRLDKGDKEPRGLLVKLFFLGVLSTIPAVIVELIAQVVLQVVPGGILYLALEYFLGVALVEEGFKYLFMKSTTWKNINFDYKFDGIVYAVFVSLGFAAAENLEYVLMGGIGVAMLRAVASIPGHCIFSIWMGYYYAQAKDAQVDGRTEMVKPLLRKALWVPVLIHGIFDFLLSLGMDFAVILWIIYVIALDIVSFSMIRRLSKEDEKLADQTVGGMPLDSFAAESSPWEPQYQNSQSPQTYTGTSAFNQMPQTPGQNSFGSDNSYGSGNSFGSGNSYGSGNSFGSDNSYGSGNSFGSGNSYGSDNSFGSDNLFGGSDNDKPFLQ